MENEDLITILRSFKREPPQVDEIFDNFQREEIQNRCNSEDNPSQYIIDETIRFLCDFLAKEIFNNDHENRKELEEQYNDGR